MLEIKYDVRYPLFVIQRRGTIYIVVEARYSEHGIPLSARRVAHCDTYEEAIEALDKAHKAAREEVQS